MVKHKRRRRRSALQWLALLFGLLLLTAIGLAGAVTVACGVLGKTPVELADYAKRRLQGHPTLEVLAVPALDLFRSALAEQDEVDVSLPFAVPALPPNPKRAVRPESPDSPGLIRVGPTRNVTTIAAAAQLAVDGSVVEIDPGDYVGDVAVWTQKDLTIRGLGERVRLIAGGSTAEGKAIWVFRSPNATVEDIDFVNARASDRNGAGIRLESGRLVVRRCLFWHNQNGILTSNDPAASLEVEQSQFAYNGGGEGLTHSIYVGAIDRFRLSGSYLHHGNVGHFVKSRARQSRVEYSRLTDEIGGRSSYELEFPNGGVVELVGNVVQQVPSGRNSTIVSIGAESYRWPANELRMGFNTLVNDLRFGGTFVRVWPGAGAVVLRNNVFVGPGKVDLTSVADVAGSREADWRELVRPSREDYRPTEAARSAWAGQGLAPVALPSLVPRAEYAHPTGVRPLAGPPSVPGALQARLP